MERALRTGKASFLGPDPIQFMYKAAIMRRSLPPLNALRSFDAAARHQSFTRAAVELCVTQGAVSHQVKALETELGLQLFKRERNGLVITEAGRDYLAVVRDVFDRLELGTDRLLQRQRSGTITVSTSPDFAAKWLVSRLGRFAEAYPEIELKLAALMHRVDFAREDVDLAIRHGDGQWPELDAVNLCAEELFPVCSVKTEKITGDVYTVKDKEFLETVLDPATAAIEQPERSHRRARLRGKTKNGQTYHQIRTGFEGAGQLRVVGDIKSRGLLPLPAASGNSGRTRLQGSRT
jgi:DNA-binding transcriptional LysR family regulator